MRRLAFVLLLLPLGLAGGACTGNPLGTATLNNVVDTVVLGALVGTNFQVPSAFSIAGSVAVRTDQTSAFDFAYNLEPDGRHVLLPAGALGISNSTGLQPGLQLSDQTFDQITDAPLNGYVGLDTIAVAVNQVYLARSSVVCTTFGVPVYAKLHILSFDDADREITFEVLANRNCGFRNLQPGLPGN
ncbi:MAG TPA: hypothetical protein VEU27_04415 [Gemmatimonadales bacterium]|jgi:hypothetical protein|nr:hypothetical protein [Gemmatimonadales bacterium]